MMNLKRTLIAAITAYFLSFIAGIITGILMGVDFSTASQAPKEVWYIGYLFSVVIITALTLWYFKEKSAKPSIKAGFQLGIAYVSIGFVLELIFIVPFILLSNSTADIGAYYLNPLFFLALAIVIATSTLVGYWRENH